VFAAVAALAGMAGDPRRACRSAAPDTVAAVASADTILLANLTAEGRIARIGETEVGLSPFGIATVRVA
jgi:hypothetical protein